MMKRFAWWSIVGTICGAFVLSCGGTGKAPEATPQLKFADNGRHTQNEAVLVVTPFAPSTYALWKAMRNEVADDLDFVTVEMNGTVTPERLQEDIERVQPKCIVLLGNRAVRVFRQLQDSQVDTPPAVVLMSSFAEELVGQLRNSTGIAYEVPGVTSFVRVRQLYKRSIKRVGVLYRPALAGFVEKQIELAKLEKFELVGHEFSGEGGSRHLRLALRELLKKQHVDALWVLNDNALLTPAAIRDAWLPEAKRSQIPIVVGVDSLVNSSIQFGSVAVVPDHEALGVQAANLLFELSESDWQVEQQAVLLPLSVETVVDMSQLSLFGLAPDADSLIDRASL